eukprot:SAG11_NODE_6788_length_1248_cov_2.434291_1_plen_93_part_01
MASQSRRFRAPHYVLLLVSIHRLVAARRVHTGIYTPTTALPGGVVGSCMKVPYVDPPQLNTIRHAQVPGKIYLYIRRYRPKRTICFFAYIAGT